jgi:hypothetical protein
MPLPFPPPRPLIPAAPGARTLGETDGDVAPERVGAVI